MKVKSNIFEGATNINKAPLIVRSVGELKEAKTAEGYTVYRQELLAIPEGTFRPAPYDNHFIFLDPVFVKGGARAKGRWFALCTCGGAAVTTGYDSYKHLGSAQGLLLVCYTHTSTGRHADGSS